MAHDDSVEISHPRDSVALISHDDATTAFERAYHAGRLPHAWLITGAEGIGKATLAYRLSRFILGGREHINAEHPITKRISSQSHADLKVVEPEQGATITADDIRALGKFLSLTPAESTHRIIIIDAADQMNRHASNALLKILEEPPANALLFLISHASGKLLPTIHSRCQALRLGTLNNDETEIILQQHAPQMTASETHFYAHIAAGSPGKALQLYQHHALALYDEMLSFFAKLPNLPTVELFSMADKISQQQQIHQWQITGMLWRYFLHRIIRIRALQTPPPMLPHEAEILQRVSIKASVDEWLELWDYYTEIWNKTNHLHLDKKQTFLLLWNQVRERYIGQLKKTG